MERKDALEDPEREDREQDRRRGELEATGAEYLPIGVNERRVAGAPTSSTSGTAISRSAR